MHSATSISVLKKGKSLSYSDHLVLGKSTLIRTINGLEAVDKGSLLVNGHQVAGASQKDLVPLRKEVGMVFQHFNLYPHKTVLENVTLAPIKVLGIDKKRS